MSRILTDAKFRSIWNLRNLEETRGRQAKLGAEGYFISGLVPKRGLTVVIGHSGVGKSPFLYQIGMSVAAGIPFGGRITNPGTVVYLDFEDSLSQSMRIQEQMCKFLKIDDKSLENSFFVLNLNDAPNKWGNSEKAVEELVATSMPDLVIIDTISTFCPSIDEKNSNSLRVYGRLRRLMSKYGTAFILAHHPKKPPDRPDERPTPLEDVQNIREWFHQARGPVSLIQNADMRIGLEIPCGEATLTDFENADEIALVMRGYGRMDMDEIPLTLWTREFDHWGDPMGYAQVRNVSMIPLSSRDYFARLPDTFTFKAGYQITRLAKQVFAKHLKRFISAGLVERDGEAYRKTRPGEIQ